MVKPRPPQIPDFNALVGRLRKAANTNAFKMIRAWAGEEAELFKREILAQDFDSFEAEPLSPRWLARKIAKHADARTMIATGTYVKSIRVFIRHDEDKTIIYVGFGEDDHAVDLDGNRVDTKLYEIAAIHEYGSEAAGIPPRPHWSVHLNGMQQRAPSLRRAIVAKTIKQVRS